MPLDFNGNTYYAKRDPESTKEIKLENWNDTIQEAADKNTPENLKTLRWAIYEAIERYNGDLGKTICGCLKMEVEDLFKVYTNS